MHICHRALIRFSFLISRVLRVLVFHLFPFNIFFLFFSVVSDFGVMCTALHGPFYTYKFVRSNQYNCIIASRTQELNDLVMQKSNFLELFSVHTVHGSFDVGVILLCT
jgi:hypothetical protein